MFYLWWDKKNWFELAMRFMVVKSTRAILFDLMESDPMTLQNEIVKQLFHIHTYIYICIRFSYKNVICCGN